jgi:hypothetical protein
MALSGAVTWDLSQTDYLMHDQYSGRCHFNVDQSSEDSRANSRHAVLRKIYGLVRTMDSSSCECIKQP